MSATNNVWSKMKSYTSFCWNTSKTQISNITQAESIPAIVFWSVLAIVVLSFIWFSWKIFQSGAGILLTILALIGLLSLYSAAASLPILAEATAKSLKKETVKA
jgi:ABC-type siderophore export system fused ATPase/permease subunit